MIQLQTLLSTSPQTSLSLTAIVDTALCVGAGGSSGSLADKPIVRNASGQLLIPGSQVKGRLRHECEKLARSLHWEVFAAPQAQPLYPKQEPGSTLSAVSGYPGYHCLISQIFGNPVLPSRIIVDDFICPLAASDLPEVFRPGVSINRRRRVAEDQKLFLLETSPANAQLEFAGTLHFLPGLPAASKPLILAALRHIHALGGSKSTGLGWLSWRLEDPSIVADCNWDALLPVEGTP